MFLVSPNPGTEVSKEGSSPTLVGYGTLEQSLNRIWDSKMSPGLQEFLLVRTCKSFLNNYRDGPRERKIKLL